jgi:hypothetical protein
LVPFQRTRVVFEILAFPELRWIDEYADDNPLGVFAGEINKRYVTCMQITHRRDERYMFVMEPPLGEMLGEILFIVNNYHDLF